MFVKYMSGRDSRPLKVTLNPGIGTNNSFSFSAMRGRLWVSYRRVNAFRGGAALIVAGLLLDVEAMDLARVLYFVSDHLHLVHLLMLLRWIAVLYLAFLVDTENAAEVVMILECGGFHSLMTRMRNLSLKMMMELIVNQTRS